MRESLRRFAVVGGTNVAVGAALMLVGVALWAAGPKGPWEVIPVVGFAVGGWFIVWGFYLVMLGNGVMGLPGMRRARLQKLLDYEDQMEAEARTNAHDTTVALKELVGLLKEEAAARSAGAKPPSGVREKGKPSRPSAGGAASRARRAPSAPRSPQPGPPRDPS